MQTRLNDHKVNTTKPNRDGAAAEQRQPHERDESPEGMAEPRGVMRQAADDLARGLVDTDLHNQTGVDPNTIDKGVRQRGPAQPQPDAADGMRGQPTATESPPRK